jgi:sulfotransferase family protein
VNFEIVWICGMPRSGTSWLSQILDSSPFVNFKMAPLFSYRFKDSVSEFSSQSQWKKFFQDVFVSDDDFLNQTERINRGEFMTFPKNQKLTHLVIKDVRHHEVIDTLIRFNLPIKVIYIVRNPNAAIYSWISSKKEFPIDKDPLKEWKMGNCRKINKSEYWGFDDWKKLTYKYLNLNKKYPNKMLIVSYKDLVKDSIKVSTEIFNFCNLKINEQTFSFLRKSQTINHKSEFSVFKNINVIDKWKGKLLPKIIKEISNDLIGTELEIFNK